MEETLSFSPFQLKNIAAALATSNISIVSNCGKIGQRMQLLRMFLKGTTKKMLSSNGNFKQIVVIRCCCNLSSTSKDHGILHMPGTNLSPVLWSSSLFVSFWRGCTTQWRNWALFLYPGIPSRGFRDENWGNYKFHVKSRNTR